MNDSVKKPGLNIRRKIIICVLILVLTSLIGTVILFYTCVLDNLKSRSAYAEDMQQKFLKYSSYQVKHMSKLNNIDDLRMVKSAELMASVLRNKYGQGNMDLDVKLYADGAIFRYDGKKAIFPEGIPEDLNTATIKPEDESGILIAAEETVNDESTGQIYNAVYAKITGDLYYAEWSLDNYASEESVSVSVDWQTMVDHIAQTLDADFMFVIRQDEGKPALLDGTNDFRNYNNIEELNLNWSTIDESLERGMIPAFLDNGFYLIHAKNYDDLVNNDENKEGDTVVDTGIVFVTLIPMKELLLNYKGLLMTFLFTMILLSVVLMIWTLATFDIIMEGGAAGKNTDDMSPSSVKKKVIVYVIVTALIMGVSCAYSYVLNDLFRKSVHTYDALGSMTDSINTARSADSRIWESMRSEYVDYADVIATLLDYNPELRNKTWLQEVSDIIDADYVMLYDTKGDEILTNSRYKGMCLGKSEESATYDFRRLLKGVSSIAHEKVEDEVTGEVRDMYGIPLEYAGKDDDLYGALIIAVDPDKRISASVMNVNEIMETHTMGGYTSFAADPKKGKIKYSSKKKLRGAYLEDLGFNMKYLKGSIMGFFNLGQAALFGRSVENEGLIYYYAIDSNDMYAGIGGFTVICMLLFLAVILLIAIVLNYGYNNETYEYYLKGGDEPAENDADAAVSADAAAVAPVKRHNVMRKIRKALGIEGSPFHMALVTLMLLGVAYLVLILFTTMSNTVNMNATNASVIRYIMKGDWEKGVNIFSISAVFFIGCVFAMVEVGLYLMRNAIKAIFDSRGSTIGALVISVVQTVAAVIALCVALGYLGVDYKAIIASVGIFSMAFSFGAKDFVADIFAGFDLLANNTYQMGDIVQVDGYTGTVQELTLRTTWLVGDGGNIKTIRNSNIGNVINLSAQNSWYPMEINVPASIDIEQLESIFEEKLPSIGAKYDMIISGPEYRGVEAVGNGKLTILILTECRQRDFFKVEKIVNKEIYSLLKKNDIQIM
ncbi:MAG: mechanosensitive ion channel family protein [Eubacterium sp.]|nr:mechanosensitive ion channel family protein [Eubacterium sp.]